MKKLWIPGLAMAMLLALGVAQVALAEVPGPIGSTNCIAYCIAGKVDHGVVTRGGKDIRVSDFARDHNPSDPTPEINECGMMKDGKTISDLNPPQPQP